MSVDAGDSWEEFCRKADEEEAEFKAGPWGCWQYEAATNVLVRLDDGRWTYEVDLDRVTNSRELIDWLAHCAEKRWPDEDLGALVQALHAKKNLRKFFPTQFKAPAPTVKPKACRRCASPQDLHEHHWAPKYAFEDADDWGTVLLCKRCHRQWHEVMTPDIHLRETWSAFLRFFQWTKAWKR